MKLPYLFAGVSLGNLIIAFSVNDPTLGTLHVVTATFAAGVAAILAWSR